MKKNNIIESYGFCMTQENYKSENDFNISKSNYRKWELNDRMLFKNTPFYTECKSFYHFTSIESLNSIIGNGKLRLYNLNNMDDKFEMEYAKEKLLFKKNDEMENYKKNIFSISMCSSNELLNDFSKQHLMWKLHGKDGKGAIIKLNLKNKDFTKWESFHLVKTIYEIDLFSNIKEFNYNNKYDELDTLICSFIKSPIYSYENEIRLVFDKSNTTTITKTCGKKFPIVFPDKLQSSNVIEYLELPLLNFFDDKNEIFKYKNTNQESKEIPFFEIEEIILGYRFDEKELKNFRKRVNPLYINSEKIRLTELKEYY